MPVIGCGVDVVYRSCGAGLLGQHIVEGTGQIEQGRHALVGEPVIGLLAGVADGHEVERAQLLEHRRRR